MYFLSNSSDYIIAKDSLRFSTGITIGICLFMTSFSLSILVLNILVVVTYVKVKYLQKTKNYFILSLAICDITIGFVPVNSYTIYLVYGYWPLGHTACNFFLIFSYSVCTVSTLTLLTIAFDRFMAVYFPITHRFNYTKCKVIFATFIIWTFAFLIWTPASLLHDNHTDEECLVQFIENNWRLSLGTAFLSYYGPLLLTMLAYFAISRKLVIRHKSIYRKRRNKQPSQRPSKTSMSSSDSTDTLDHFTRTKDEKASTDSLCVETQVTEGLSSRTARENSSDNNNNGANKNQNAKTETRKLTVTDRLFQNGYIPEKSKTRNVKKHRRSLRLLLMVIAAFGIAWLPYHILLTIMSTGRRVPIPYWNFAYIFGWANSLFNPFCYAFGNKHFSTAFKSVFFKKKTTSMSVFSMSE